jgi:cytoskeletal protein CcmA (bactofilin family)
MKLRASAITYSLVVTLLVSMLLASLVLLHAYTRVATDTSYFQEIARDNLESGRNLVLFGKGSRFGEWREPLFDSGLDSFAVNCRPWGLFGVMVAEGMHGPWKESETVLFGMRPEEEFKASLFLKDRNRPLTLAGDTKLKGPLYIPESGIRRGYVGRDGYVGTDLYTGEKFSSAGKEITADYDNLMETREWLKATWESRWGESDLADSMVASWSGNPLEIRSGRPVVLAQRIQGQVIVMAPEIVVSSEAQIEGALLFARYIKIETGFRGNLQAFATDTLEVEEEVHLSYPSILLVANPDGQGNLVLGKNSTLEGMMVNDNAFLGGKEDAGSYTLIAAGAEVTGTVYVPHNLDVQGSIVGHTITGNFILRTPSSVYENHLYNARIGQEGLHPRYGMGLLVADPAEFIILKYLR